MMLKVQKRLAAQILKCSPKRVRFSEEKLGEIKESITKTDIRKLINQRAIVKIPKKGISRVRARFRASQKRKGRRKNPGNRQGTRYARLRRKLRWMLNIRKQRKFLKALKEKKLINNQTYRMLYMRAKGGFFRNKRHIKLYLQEHNLIVKKNE